MLLNKTSLSAVQFCSTDASRLALNGIYVTPTETVATDGRRMVKVTHPINQDDADFPSIAGNKGGKPDDLKPAIIDMDSVKTLLKVLPKGIQTKRLPILVNCIIDVEKTNANGHMIASVTDLDSSQTISLRKIDMTFPDYDRVLPRTEPTLIMGFDAKLLGESLLAIAGMTGNSFGRVKLSFYGNGKDENNPLVLESENTETGQKIKAVVMPTRF